MRSLPQLTAMKPGRSGAHQQESTTTIPSIVSDTYPIHDLGGFYEFYTHMIYDICKIFANIAMSRWLNMIKPCYTPRFDAKIMTPHIMWLKPTAGFRQNDTNTECFRLWLSMAQHGTCHFREEVPRSIAEDFKAQLLTNDVVATLPHHDGRLSFQCRSAPLPQKKGHEFWSHPQNINLDIWWYKWWWYKWWWYKWWWYELSLYELRRYKLA